MNDGIRQKEMGFDKKVGPAMRSFSNNYDFSGVNDGIRQKEMGFDKKVGPAMRKMICHELLNQPL